MREIDIQANIVEYLTKAGWFVVKNDNKRRMGVKKGRADLTCFGPRGQFMEIEVKDAKGKQSTAQKVYQLDLEARGHRYLIARSLEDVIEALEEMKWTIL